MRVDRQESQGIPHRVLARYERSFNALAPLAGTTFAEEIIGESGATYHVNVDIHWDSIEHRRIRVTASVDDGGWRAFYPMTKSLIVTKPQIFVREPAVEVAPTEAGRVRT